MSRTKRGAKPFGYEFWSRRYKNAMTCGKYAKRLTHRFERQQGKREAAER